MSPEKPTPPDQPSEQPGNLRENPDLEDFFNRLPSNLRWPKPDAAAVAAAVEAIQRLSAGPAADETAAVSLEDAASAGPSCSGCGLPLREGMKFCGHCGAPVAGASAQPQSWPAGQHHYHHHYHHFVPAQAAGSSPWPGADSTAAAAPVGRGSGSVAKGSTGGRAEHAARQLVQDWAQACNIKHLDDLLELYTPDATVIRSNIAPVRSLSAIREFLFSLLEAGLGDVEMESLRTDILGEVALDMGRCKMLVPVAMGKRREERGKYLLVLTRQPAGSWKILVDCWSSDLAVSTLVAPEAGRKGIEPAGPARKPR